jgi:hypothetical protein
MSWYWSFGFSVVGVIAEGSRETSATALVVFSA